MADQTYEVRIDGLVPTEVLLEQFRGAELAEHESRTVLSGRFVDQAELYAFLNLLRSYGLEVVEVRRVPHRRVHHRRPGRGERPMTSHPRPASTYELTVTGRLGPVLRAAIDPTARSRFEVQTTMRVQAREGEGLVDLLQRLRSRGLEITTISTIP